MHSRLNKWYRDLINLNTPGLKLSAELSDDVQKIRSRICNGFLITIAIWAFPAITASLYRIKLIGWQPVMAVHLVIGLLICFAAIYRKKISYTLRACVVLVTFLVIGLGGLLQFGLLAGGTPFLVGAGAIACMLFGLRTGLYILFISLLGGGAIGMAIIMDYVSINIDPSSYMVAFTSWLNAFIVWVLIAISLTVSIYIFNKSLINALERSRKNEDKLQYQQKNLEEIVEQRTIELTNSNEELERAISMINKQSDILRELSIHDELTGLYNRRYFNEQAQQLFQQAKRYSRPLNIMLGDIDLFKVINDSFGHSIGDDVLKTIASIINKNLREVDVVARFGGEEFVIIFPETTQDKTLEICERLRKGIESYPWQDITDGLRVTMSIGICGDTKLKTIEEMLKKADEKLYQAKEKGRNLVCW